MTVLAAAAAAAVVTYFFSCLSLAGNPFLASFLFANGMKRWGARVRDAGRYDGMW